MKETIPVTHLHSRLRQLSAVYRPDKTQNANVAHVYYAAPSKRWLLVRRSGPHHATIHYYDTCPCALTQASVR